MVNHFFKVIYIAQRVVVNITCSVSFVKEPVKLAVIVHGFVVEHGLLAKCLGPSTYRMEPALLPGVHCDPASGRGEGCRAAGGHAQRPGQGQQTRVPARPLGQKR